MKNNGAKSLIPISKEFEALHFNESKKKLIAILSINFGVFLFFLVLELNLELVGITFFFSAYVSFGRSSSI